MLLHKCIYLYPSFSKMESNDMLRTINSDFSQKSFVMLYVNIFLQKCTYLYPYFAKMMWNDMLSTINSDSSQRSNVMQYVKNFLKNMYLFLSLIFSNCVKRHVEKDKLRFKPEIICNAFCMCRFFCKDVYIFTPIFLKWCQTTCWVR